MQYRLEEVGCPHCGHKKLELKTNINSKSIWKRMAVGIMVAWVVYNISVILVWNFVFQREGLFTVLFVLLLGLLVVTFLHSDFRQTILQKEYELGKMQCEIESLKQRKASFE